LSCALNVSAGLKDNPPKGFLEAIEKLSPEEKSQIYILERIGKFMMQLHKDEASPVISEKDKEKGYVLFSRNYNVSVYPNSTPLAEEIVQEIKISAARGEYEPTTVAVYPLKELNGANVTVSDLVGKGGTIKSDCVDVRVVNYLIEGRTPVFTINPTVLCKDKDLLMRKEVCWRYWLTLKAPQDIPAGEYSGKIKFACLNAPASEISLKVTVYPFSLPENTDVSFGLWGTFERGKEGLLDQKEHGINAGDMSAAWNKKGAKAEVTSFDTLNKQVAMLKELKMDGPHTIMPSYSRPSQGRPDRPDPEYDSAYKDAVSQIWKWGEKEKIGLLIWTTDEPRETRENPWRLNGVELMNLMQLYKDLPEVKTVVTFSGGSYSEIVPLLSVASFHATAGAQPILDAVRKNNKISWIYNSGNSRYSWGFCTWRLGAKGRWEWEYNPCPGSGAMTWPGMYNNTYAPIGENTSRHPAEPRPIWEIAREGIDDYKYVYSLEQLIKKTEQAGNAKSKEAAGKAVEYLKSIKEWMPEISAKVSSDTHDAADRADLWKKPEELDRCRQKIAQFIIQLGD